MVSRWDMKYDIRTKEIVLENHDTGEIEPMGLFMPIGV